jgi:hypothetical protein
MLSPHRITQSALLVCRYRSGFLWGILSGWARPAGGDALVALGTDRRGCLTLPDPDCCYLPVDTRALLRPLVPTPPPFLLSLLLSLVAINALICA